MTALVLIATASVAFGALSGRWSALALPPLLVALFYAGLVYGWWGNGVGDAWQFAAVVVAAIITAATAVAIAVARLRDGRPSRGPA